MWDVPTDGDMETRERSCTTKDALFTRRLPSCHLKKNATQSSKNTVKRSRDRWHHWSIVRVRFGELWIFMMLIYWVAIGARTANKLSPPCLKGKALSILKMLSRSFKFRLQVASMPIVKPRCCLLLGETEKPACHCYNQSDLLRNLRTLRQMKL